MIEKHFTLSRALPGTDHVVWATPEEFLAMVEQIREAETLLGEARKSSMAREREIREFVRNRFPK